MFKILGSVSNVVESMGESIINVADTARDATSIMRLEVHKSLHNSYKEIGDKEEVLKLLKENNEILKLLNSRE